MALTKADQDRSRKEAERLKMRLEAEGGWNLEVVVLADGRRCLRAIPEIPAGEQE